MDNLKNLTVSILIAVFLLCADTGLAKTVFTYRSKETESDERRNYNKELLQLALEKTVVTYGPYKLVPSPMMNAARSEIVAKNGTLENFFIKLSVSKKRMRDMTFINFPVDRGIVGYRVFWVSPRVRDSLKSVETFEQLSQFSIGQGIGWLDAKILKYNGFNVITGSTYEGLFKMVAKGRFDLFPRGANEIYGEIKSHPNIKNLVLDDSISLYYPLPRFFFTAKKNIEATSRIAEGLKIAYNDGSFLKLWEKHYRQSVEFVNLKFRKIFKIDNPFLQGVDNSYEKYFYHP